MTERAPTEQRREQIIDALMVVMAEHGYAKATIAKVAVEAGLNHGLLHYHFKKKQEILIALLERLAQEQLVVIDRLEGPPRQKLTAVIDLLLATGEQARPEAVAAWVTIAVEAIRQPEVAEVFETQMQNFGARLTAVIEAGVAAGEFEPDRPTAEIVGALLAMVQGYYTLAATARDLVPVSSAAPAAKRLLTAMLREDLT